MGSTLARVAAALIIVIGGIATTSARAQGLSMIRDSEIEHILRSWATPLIEVAPNVYPENVRILIVNDPGLNAFVAGGQNMFVNTGLLMESSGPSQIIGVMAHEIGHIAGGHLARAGGAIDAARDATLLHTLLGLGIIALGAATGARGTAEAGSAVIAGGQSVGQRTFLAYTQSEENAADQASLTYLDATQRSARGLLAMFDQLKDQEVMVIERQDPYVQTHPAISERIRAVQAHVDASPWSDVPDPPEDVAAFARMRAKLMGFLAGSRALREYPASDTSVAARYARAVAYFKRPDLERSLVEMNSLLAEYPDDPFFQELKGQILFESQRGTDAIPYYRKANELRPDDALLMTMLAQVLIEVDVEAHGAEAIGLLDRSSRLDATNPTTWRLLSTGYGRQNDIGRSSLAAAEQALLENRPGDALFHANKAERSFAEGTSGWLRAQDIRGVAEREMAALRRR